MAQGVDLDPARSGHLRSDADAPEQVLRLDGSTERRREDEAGVPPEVASLKRLGGLGGLAAGQQCHDGTQRHCAATGLGLGVGDNERPIQSRQRAADASVPTFQVDVLQRSVSASDAGARSRGSVSMCEADLTAAEGTLARVATEGRLEDCEPLLFDHDQIVSTAVKALRVRFDFRYRYVDISPDPDGFLPAPFTLYELRNVHEAVVGAELHKDNFNRRMKPFLEPLVRKGEPVLSDGLRGRPAALYRSAVR